jgi:hypothetical protein
MPARRRLPSLRRCRRRRRGRRTQAPQHERPRFHGRSGGARRARDLADAGGPDSVRGHPPREAPRSAPAPLRAFAAEPRRASRLAPRRQAPRRATPRPAVGRPRISARQPRARACVGHAPSMRPRRSGRARRRRSPTWPGRTRVAAPSTRHSGARATAQGIRSARTPAERAGSASVGTRRTERGRANRRSRTAPAARDRARAPSDATRQCVTTSCRVRVRSAAPRGARAGRPERAPDRPES